MIRQLDDLQRQYEKERARKKRDGTSQEALRDLSWEYDQEQRIIEDDLWRETSWYYQTEADRALIPVPEYSTSSGHWAESELYPGRYYLAKSSLVEIRRQINAEKKERKEQWAVLAAMVTGLVGAVSGLAAVLAK